MLSSKVTSSWIAALIALSSVELADILPGEDFPLPIPFKDSFLPDSQITGEEIKYLGRVMQLNTIMSPKNVLELKTKFNIYTRTKSTSRIAFEPMIKCVQDRCVGPYQYNLDYLAYSGYNSSARTIVIIAGYLSDEEVVWIQEMRKLWLELADVNVIEVTWSDSNKYLYSRAVAHTPLVARQITIFLYYLAELNGRHLHEDDYLDNIHLIGHSLGAHICGFVGKDLTLSSTLGRVGRITGLDPAGPSFDRFSYNERLYKSDAKLVEVIHTNGGTMRYLNAAAGFSLEAIDKALSLIYQSKMSESLKGNGTTAWFGLDENLGHIDYYANDGREQPGCPGITHICDHGRAHEIFRAILRREIEVRKLNMSEEQRRRSRLVAFNALDYNEFTVGTNFKDHCYELMAREQHLTESSLENIKHCSIPLDFTTPVKDVMEELALHNVDFEYSEYMTSRRYFFKTLDSHPLVNDHYLLKLYLGEKSNWQSENCILDVAIEMSDTKSIEFNLNKILESTRPVDEVDRMVAVPFVHPFSVSQTRTPLNELMTLGRERNATKIDSFREILPVKITFSVVPTMSSGILTNITKGWFNFKDDAKCALDIDMVEVHPVIRQENNFGAIYYYARDAYRRIEVLSINEVHKHDLELKFRITTLTKKQIILSLYGLIVG